MSISFIGSSAVNFLVYKRLTPSLTPKGSTAFLAALIFSSALQTSKPYVLDKTKHWSPQNKRLLKEFYSSAPFLILMGTGLYGGMSMIQSASAAALLDTVHKKVMPDLCVRSTYQNPKEKVRKLPKYLLAQAFEKVSLIQNLFNMAIYLTFSLISFRKYYDKKKLLELHQALENGLTNVDQIKAKLAQIPYDSRCEMYRQIYLIKKPTTSNPNWGEEHACDDLGALKQALTNTVDSLFFYQWENGLWVPSHIYKLNGDPLVKNRIAFINGLGTIHETAKHWDAEQIRSAYAPKKQIYGVYLATRGLNPWGHFYDYAEAILGHSYVPTYVVKEIHQMWDEFFADPNNTGEFLHFCASKGSIMTSVALSTYPHPERIPRIRVIAVTPAVFIPKEIGANVMHFASLKDLFPYLAPGRERLLENDEAVTIVDAPGEDRLDSGELRSPHDPHGKPYQEAIKSYLRTTPWKDLVTL